VLEQDYHYQESYALVHHCGFSLEDVNKMTFIERTEYLKLRNEESERESAEIENMKSK
jgi:hypothetical protein|tara:strand:- start:150 stop:323 length:174 start_codon:yes stop_codon:yes gene_type:complete